MEFDYSNLRKRIREKHLSEGLFAIRLGLSKSALSLRLNNHLFFSQRDIATALRVLGIPKEEVGNYFLCRKKDVWREFW